jgi:hypothetical protein
VPMKEGCRRKKVYEGKYENMVEEKKKLGVR